MDGFEQGEGSISGVEDDSSLPALQRVQKYARSPNILHRQMVGRIVQDLLRTLPGETLENDLPDIMKELVRIGDESILRADLLDQIPDIADNITLLCSNKFSNLKDTICDYLVPLVVRNLGCPDAVVDKAARTALIRMIEGGLITKFQIEIKVCPSILALSKTEASTDINTNTGAITLMSKLAQYLGRDVMERVFLKRFTELCASPMFYIRKICATSFGEFCNVVGTSAFENILLPCYITLCNDGVWGVRKACAEVFMYVSCSCPSNSRSELLAPMFIKLLQDDCRWVRVAAYQALGPFISTFANPVLTKLAYNENGDLVLVNNRGDEFLMNCSRSVSAMDNFMRLSNREKDVDVIINPLAKENWYFDFKTMKFEKMLDNEEVDEVNSNIVNPESGEKISQIVENELEKEMDNVFISDSLDISNLNTNAIVSHEINANEGEINTESNSTNSTKDVNDNNKVNKVDLEDDLYLFNSHIYWYISPDLPLDLNIIAGQETTAKREPPDYLKSHIKDLSTILTTGTEPNEESTIVEDSEDNTISDNNETEESKYIAQQDIIPQPLIDHFVAMTDRNLCMQIDNELSYHCAYSVPAVASTLGKDNWHFLKDTVEYLASDMQYKVRKTIASSLHELAIILGPEMATEYLTPLFDGFIKDLDEVRIGVLKHLAQFLKLINADARTSYLPKLVEFLRTDNEWNWRFRHELAEQLLEAVRLFKPSDTAKYIGVIAIDLLRDKVAAVREMAIHLVTEVIRYISAEPGLTPNLLVKLAENFAHSKKWKRRQTFCLLCCQLLKEDTLTPEQFSADIMPHLLDLSWDPVANVRLVVARCLVQYVITNEYFTNPNNEHHDGLETVLRRLQADKDQDVRQTAGLD